MLHQFFLFSIFCISTINFTYSSSLKGSCSPPDVYKEDVINLKRMSGSWYAIASSNEHDGDLESRCVLLDLVLTSEGSLWWIEAGLRKFHSFEQYSRLWPTKFTEPGTLQSYNIDTDGTVKDRRKEWVLFNDYDKFVAYTCREDAASGTFYGNFYIQSRNPKICDKDWQLILTAIGNANIINKLGSPVMNVDHTNCPNNDLRKALASLDSQFMSV